MKIPRPDLLNTIMLLCLFLAPLFLKGQELAMQTSIINEEIKQQDQNQSLKQVLEDISKKYKVNFGYTDQLVDKKEVNVKLINGEQLEDVLQKILAPFNLNYKKLEENFYVIHRDKKSNTKEKIEKVKKEANALEKSVIERIDKINYQIIKRNFTQAKTVSGRVTSFDDKQGLPGVNVIEKGTDNGTVTNIEGEYSLQVSDGAILVFSSIGYTPEEIEVGNRSVIDLTMTQDIQQLQELVVVGYGTQDRKSITGSVVRADLESFEEAPNTSVLQTLSGTLPGVNVNQTSRAGEEASIQIRGQTSINGSQQPLIVVDGIIYRGRLSDLNPRDIESIDVLKDVSSMAIYGAQAANGVVLVTTKQGIEDRPITISYSGNFATQTPSNELAPLQRDGYLQAARDIDWQNSYLPPDYTEPNPNWTFENNVPFFPIIGQGLRDGTDYNWYDEVTDPGYITNHHLNVTGGTGKTSFFVSGGYTNQEGWMLNDTWERFTGRINLDLEITDWLTVGANSFGSFSDFSGESPQLGTLARSSPLAKPRDEEGNFIINPNGDLALNPFLISASDDLELRNNLSGIFYGQVIVPWIKGLSYRINMSHNYRWSNTANANIYGAGQTGSAGKFNETTYDFMLDNILTYKNNFNEHGLEVTLVYGLNRINYEATLATGNNFPNLKLSYNNLETAVNQFIESRAWEEAFLYQMARVNYNFKGKYNITATVRRDGFSGFSDNNKIALFPSVGVGWFISDEPFMQNINTFTNLKFRASYGINGNLTSRYSSLARVASPDDSRYVFGDGGSTVNGITTTSLANPNLTWETTQGVNVGLDFGLLEGRLAGSLDYYQTITTDLLWDFSLPELTGFNDIRTNLGKIANSGFEAIINAIPVQNQNFSWNINFNFATNNNEIQELIGLDSDGDGREDDLIANGLFIGESIGTIYGYEINGLYQIDDDDIPSGWVPGTYRIVDLNNDGELTPQGDRKILGRREPSYSFGIQNTFNYKNFSFRFFIKSIQGGQNGYLGVNNPPLADTPGNAQSSNWYSEIDYWSPSNPNALFRLPGSERPLPANRFFQRNFVRLQDISLAYNFNRDLVDKLGMNGLKVFVSGKNLITLTDWLGWDPEPGNDGIAFEFGGLPIMQGISAGIDISF